MSVYFSSSIWSMLYNNIIYCNSHLHHPYLSNYLIADWVVHNLLVQLSMIIAEVRFQDHFSEVSFVFPGLVRKGGMMRITVLILSSWCIFWSFIQYICYIVHYKTYKNVIIEGIMSRRRRRINCTLNLNESIPI